MFVMEHVAHIFVEFLIKISRHLGSDMRRPQRDTNKRLTDRLRLIICVKTIIQALIKLTILLAMNLVFLHGGLLSFC